MTLDFLGNALLRKEEILAKIGSITILKTGQRIPSKSVRLILRGCPYCERLITDPRELKFIKTVQRCYSCCTGNILDFCHRTSCLTFPTSRIEEAKELLERVIGDKVTFRTVPSARDYRRTELHWSYWPEEGFYRVGYDIFRLLGNLTREEIEESFDVAIHGSMPELIALTRPRWKKWYTKSS